MDDITRKIADLRAEGISADEISRRLGVTLEQVAQADYDETDAESFPASDPPPGPGV